MPTIIAEDLNFAFIHIPKCGGTSFGRQLRDQTRADPRFLGEAVHSDPEEGEAHTDHLTMRMYRNSFPDALARLQAFDTMAILRDPFSRFRSSLSEHLRLTEARELWRLTEAELRGLVARLLRPSPPRRTCKQREPDLMMTPPAVLPAGLGQGSARCT